jgi:hypothetical protein
VADNHENSSGFTIKKKVDETWKDNAEKEKESVESAHEPKADAAPSFSSLVTTLGMQAFMALGELQSSEAPTEPPVIDLAQAKALIELLQVLSDKTQGNLTQEESSMLAEILYGLKMKFVEKSKRP